MKSPLDFPSDLNDFEKIKELRAFANENLGREHRSSQTVARYLKIARKHLDEDHRDSLSPESMRKRTWFSVRAACRFFLSGKILEELSKIDKRKREGDLEGAKKALQWALWSQDFLKTKLSEPATFSPERERKENRGKRRTLGSLPSDWPSRVFSAAPESLRPAIAIHFLAGVRPEELERGILISKTPDGIEFIIPGAKVYQKGGLQVGQKERRIRLVFSTDLERRMADILTEGVTSCKKDTVRKGLLRLSRTLFPRHSRPVSGYSFRHLFSSRVKRSGVGEEEIALAMGHASCRTQSQYGTARQSSGGMSVSVSATTPPRHPGRRSGPDASGSPVSGPSA